jgi:predicted O-methyltransferase YrrM
MRNPIFFVVQLRPLIAQHTRAEHAALQHWARDRHSLVEIGVAEGASATLFRKAMAPDATLYLIDPFHLSRVQWLNPPRLAAHKAVNQSHNGTVIWLQKFSTDVAAQWDTNIDFLFLDGDHTEQGVWRDWNDWSRFVIPGGVVLFHDSRLFEQGWTEPRNGPVKVVNQLFREQTNHEWRIVDEVHSLTVVERVA